MILVPDVLHANSPSIGVPHKSNAWNVKMDLYMIKGTQNALLAQIQLLLKEMASVLVAQKNPTTTKMLEFVFTVEREQLIIQNLEFARQIQLLQSAHKEDFMTNFWKNVSAQAKNHMTLDRLALPAILQCSGIKIQNPVPHVRMEVL